LKKLQTTEDPANTLSEHLNHIESETNTYSLQAAS